MKSARPPESKEVAGLLERAIECHLLGQLTQAQNLYEKILQDQPKHFDAMHLLGVVWVQTGRFADAERRSYLRERVSEWLM